MNNLSFTGRLAADAEKRFTQNGTAILSFTVANDVGYGDRKVTNWYRCSIIGKRAESRLSEFLVKGQQVGVTGQHQMREYDKKDGTKGYSNEVNVNEVDLLGSKSESSNGQAPVKQAPAMPDDFSDDIPF